MTKDSKKSEKKEEKDTGKATVGTQTMITGRHPTNSLYYLLLIFREEIMSARAGVLTPPATSSPNSNSDSDSQSDTESRGSTC